MYIIVFAEQFLNIDLVSSCLLVWSASHKQMTLVMQTRSRHFAKPQISGTSGYVRNSCDESVFFQLLRKYF